MITIRVRLYGTLRRLSKPNTPGLWEGEVSDSTTIEELLHILGTTTAEPSNAVINGEIVTFDTVIPDAAQVILVTPMGGG